MTEGKSFIQDALDAWLSDEPGTGPAEDDPWRAKQGFFKRSWRSEGGTPEAGSEQPSDHYEQDRAALAAAMASLMRQLNYAFPNVDAMGIAEIAAAAAWIADMESRIVPQVAPALIEKARGRTELYDELVAALGEFRRLKQAYSMRRGRIEKAQQEELARINAAPAAFMAGSQPRRQEVWQQVDDDARSAWQREWDRSSEENDRRHRAAVRRIRGETLIRVVIDPDD